MTYKNIYYYVLLANGKSKTRKAAIFLLIKNTDSNMGHLLQVNME